MVSCLMVPFLALLQLQLTDFACSCLSCAPLLYSECSQMRAVSICNGKSAIFSLCLPFHEHVSLFPNYSAYSTRHIKQICFAIERMSTAYAAPKVLLTLVPATSALLTHLLPLGNKSCKFCGFVSEDNDTLIRHQIEFHQDILKSAQAKFAKELASAGGDESIAEFSANFESMSEELSNRGASSSSSFHMNNLSASKPKSKKLQREFRQEQTGDGSSMRALHNMRQQMQQQHYNSTPNNGNEEEADEFDWKAGFVDNNYYDDQRFYGHPDSVNTSGSSTPKSLSSLSKDALPATRIRRQYSCNDCSFRTVNPREFLYHRRDGHGHKIKIELCPYCIYACQYTQVRLCVLFACCIASRFSVDNWQFFYIALFRSYNGILYWFTGKRAPVPWSLLRMSSTPVRRATSAVDNTKSGCQLVNRAPTETASSTMTSATRTLSQVCFPFHFHAGFTRVLTLPILPFSFNRFVVRHVDG